MLSVCLKLHSRVKFDVVAQVDCVFVFLNPPLKRSVTDCTWQRDISIGTYGYNHPEHNDISLRVWGALIISRRQSVFCLLVCSYDTDWDVCVSGSCWAVCVCAPSQGPALTRPYPAPSYTPLFFVRQCVNKNCESDVEIRPNGVKCVQKHNPVDIRDCLTSYQVSPFVQTWDFGGAFSINVKT